MESIEVRSRFEPVWIEGEMKTGSLQKNLYLVDGAADIHIGYSMTGATVERYKKEDD